MTWLYTLLAALLAGLAGGAASLFVADRAMRWYQVSSFEGKSGYAVVGLTLLGALASVIVGLVAARIGVACGWRGFGGQLVWAVGVTTAAVALVGVVARLLADVPPTLDGSTLDLDIELRFPADQLDRPQLDPARCTLHLGALKAVRNVVRTRRSGTLDFDALRRDDGRWILPGRVPLFTARGRRVAWVTLGDHTQGFILPLPAHPTSTHRTWSTWLPHPAPGHAPTPALPLTYRFRITPVRE